MRCPQGRVSLCGQQATCTVGREQLLEALLILYQECTSPELMKIHNVANFVNKCKHALCRVVKKKAILLCLSCFVSIVVVTVDKSGTVAKACLCGFRTAATVFFKVMSL